MGNTPYVRLMPAMTFDDFCLQAAFMEAVQDWFAGNGEALHAKFPGAYYLLEQSPVRIFRAAIEKSIAIRKEAAEAIASNLIQCHKDSILSLDQVEGDNRPFDIIARYNDLLLIEQSMIEQGILDLDKQYVPSKKDSNKRCLAGVYRLLIKYGYFKKFDPDKIHNNKRLTKYEIYRFLNQRYGLPKFQELQRKGNFEEVALIRLPVIELLQKVR